ncbi:MAG: carbohydrate porin [Succinivibrio sp.]|nr:carbohydrate porin [Succinivibrio sp.]
MKKVNLLAAAVLAAAFAMPAQADYTPNANFNGYLRSGVMHGNSAFGSKTEVGKLGRLGNENDTFMEFGLGADVAKVDDTVWSVNTMLAVSHDGYQGDWVSLGDCGALRQFYASVKGIMDWDKDASVWIGKRFYRREDIHITDKYYHDVSGNGAGIENVALGSGKLSVAWLRNDDGLDYHEDFDKNVYKVTGKPSKVALHFFDVEYDFPVWDGANMEIRNTYMLPRKDSDNSWYTAETKGTNNLMIELNQGYSLGWNKTVLQYQYGPQAGMNVFGFQRWGAGDGQSGLADSAWGINLMNFGETHFTENFGMFHVIGAHFAGGRDGLATYENGALTNVKESSFKDKKAFQLVVRPYYKLTKMTRLLLEAGFYTESTTHWAKASVNDINYVTENTSNVQAKKVTLAYALTPDAGNFWSRPELRFYVSYLKGGNDQGTLGQYGNSDYTVSSATDERFGYSHKKANQFIFGAQAEAWW